MNKSEVAESQSKPFGTSRAPLRTFPEPLVPQVPEIPSRGLIARPIRESKSGWIQIHESESDSFFANESGWIRIHIDESESGRIQIRIFKSESGQRIRDSNS